jgi:hypothetical protein
VTKRIFLAALAFGAALLQVPSALAADWTQKLPANSPPARSFPVMAYDTARGQDVLFGGEAANNSTQLMDTWVWDGSNWTQKSPANSPPAGGYAMAYDALRQQVVLFGGGNADTWVWDGSNWTLKSPANRPPPRGGHAMAYDAAHGQVVMFGGSGSDPLSDLGDTWVWDGSNWTQKTPANRPGARAEHAMAYDSAHGQVVLFGGAPNTAGRTFEFLSDTWVWDGFNWTQKSPANSPVARRLPGMSSEPTRGLVLLFGGTVMGTTPGVEFPVSDTWIWDGSNWSQQAPAHSPPARTGPAMAYSATGQTVMFGGFSDHALADTWVWAQFLSVSPLTLNFGYNGSLITGPQLATVNFTGTPPAPSWTASSDQSNITVSPTSGTGSGTLTVAAIAGPSGTVTVSGAGVIQVNDRMVFIAPPFGSFDTPVDNTTGVAGAIPITGWALDTIEVTHVDILREPVTGEPPGNLIFIGTAVFVAGARPDVAALFPSYPYQNRAGWGYQMLTNFLPNASGSGAPGNGTYKLHAIAFNKAGLQLDLGTKTITVDNAHATKPFGTIDTPTQGGTISGTDSVNFGWALTPQPGMIPNDGSTITVVIDGAPVGHPTYNQFRSDIASLFPGYKNSMGAVGFFHLNTTTLANGVHTISWNVFDDLGHGEGLGSRYFNVLNTGGSGAAAPEDLIDESVAKEGVRVRHILEVNGPPEPVTPDADGGYSVTMEEVGHLELHLGAITGNMVVQGEAQMLPTGSTLTSGVFYWQPGPGFVGDYTMQFERPDGTKIPVRVNIRPKRY